MAASDDLKSKLAQDKKNLISSDDKKELAEEVSPVIGEDSKDPKSIQRRSVDAVQVEGQGGTPTEVSALPKSSDQAGEKSNDTENPPAADAVDNGS